MQKNVKGFVGLIAGLLAFVSIIIAFIPTTPIEGTNAVFYGSINIAFAVAGIVLGIVAIVAGALSRKPTDKKGPRKSGIIIGIFAVIIAIFALGITATLSLITDYANGKDVPAFSEMDGSHKEQIDNLVDMLKGM
ncbi:MAG: hypothetical protein IJV39_02955 [Ruminococcus sp.]|nr:hypothetical protein [Ruminococcus sp.]